MVNRSSSTVLNSSSPIRRRVIVFAILIVGLGLGTRHLDASAGESGSVVPVVVDVIQRYKIVDEVPLTGTVLARRYAKLSSEVSGLVNEVPVEAGDYVDAGAVVCIIDATLPELNLKEAEADLRRAEATLEEAVRKREEADSLAREQVIAATEGAALQSNVRIQQAEVNRLTTVVERMHELLSRHRIRAPFGGLVIAKDTEVGEWVQTGQQAVTMVEIDRVWVEVPLPQIYYNRIRTNTVGQVRFEALPGRPFQGVVSAKIAFGSRSARTFPVRIDLKNPNREIAPGMSARVQLSFNDESGTAALLAPRDAVVMDPDGKEWLTVVRESPSGTTVARRLPVGTGRLVRDRIEVHPEGDSLQPGDRVVVRGNEILEDGATVRVLQAR